MYWSNDLSTACSLRPKISAHFEKYVFVVGSTRGGSGKKCACTDKRWEGQNVIIFVSLTSFRKLYICLFLFS